VAGQSPDDVWTEEATMRRAEFGKRLGLKDEIADMLINYCPEDKVDEAVVALVDIIAQHVSFALTDSTESIVESVTD